MHARRVAIVHDWLTIPGGSEKVVTALCGLYPEAEVYTSIYDPAQWADAFAGHRVHASFLDRVPGARRIYPRLLPFMNAAFESFDLSGYDLVVSSSHSSAKNVVTSPETLHVCYCHTPMRYAWEPDFLHGERLGPATRLTLPLLLGHLRRVDLAGASRPDVFVANSREVAGRIEKHYRRDARVIHPPVDVARFLDVPRADQGYYLCLGRVVPYKRVDLAVAACERLGRPLKVAGTGRGLDSVRAPASRHTEFLGHVEDSALPELIAGARALLFPGKEDFGMVPIEAQAAGVPVVAFGQGGVLDSVIERETGVLFGDQSVVGLCEGIEELEASSFDEAAIRDNARRFAPEAFCEAFADLVESSLADRAGEPGGERRADRR